MNGDLNLLSANNVKDIRQNILLHRVTDSHRGEET